MKLYFCKDGVLRVFHNMDEPMLPCTFVQEEMDLAGEDFVFFSRFLTKEATFEKGLTFQNFLRCLAPWIDFWTTYTQVNLDSYLHYVNKLHVVQDEPYVESIEFSTFINIESGIAYIINDKLVRAEDIGFLMDRFSHQLDPTLALGAAFNIENMFYLRGYNKKVEHFSFDITNTPVYEYMYAPLTIRKRTNVIVSEEGSKTLMQMKGTSSKKQVKSPNLVFSKDFPGTQRMITGSSFEDDSYSYIEGDHAFSLEEMIREIFRYMPIEPITEANDYSQAIHQAFKLCNEYEGKVTSSDLSAIIGGVLEDIWAKQLNKYDEDNYLPQDKNFQDNITEKALKITAEEKEDSKIVPLYVEKTQGNNNVGNNDTNNVLSLKDFKQKKQSDSMTYHDVDISIDDDKEADDKIYQLMVVEAKSQGINLKESFALEQNHQEENRIMGILQEPQFELFDAIQYLKDDNLK